MLSYECGSNYRFVGWLAWTIDKNNDNRRIYTKVRSKDATCEVQLASNETRTIVRGATAIFAPMDKFVVIPKYDFRLGFISGGITDTEGKIRLELTPNEGYISTGWRINGTKVSFNDDIIEYSSHLDLVVTRDELLSYGAEFAKGNVGRIIETGPINVVADDEYSIKDYYAIYDSQSCDEVSELWKVYFSISEEDMNKGVATIDSYGNINALKEGSITIKIISVHDDRVYANIVVNVREEA